MLKRLGTDSVKHELHQNYKAVLTTQDRILHLSVCDSKLIIWCLFPLYYICDKGLLYTHWNLTKEVEKPVFSKKKPNRSDLNSSSYGGWSLAYCNFSWNRKLIILVEIQAKHIMHFSQLWCGSMIYPCSYLIIYFNQWMYGCLDSICLCTIALDKQVLAHTIYYQYVCSVFSPPFHCFYFFWYQHLARTYF